MNFALCPHVSNFAKKNNSGVVRFVRLLWKEIWKMVKCCHYSCTLHVTWLKICHFLRIVVESDPQICGFTDALEEKNTNAVATLFDVNKELFTPRRNSLCMTQNVNFLLVWGPELSWRFHQNNFIFFNEWLGHAEIWSKLFVRVLYDIGYERNRCIFFILETIILLLVADISIFHVISFF